NVYAFEPSLEAFRRLLNNLRENQTQNVHAFHCAVSSSSGFANFYEPQSHLTNGSPFPEFASRFSNQVCQKTVLTLAGSCLEVVIVPGHKVLLKIDVEGAEGIVLRSLQQF